MDWKNLPEKPTEGVQVLIKCKPHLPNQYFLGQRTNREMCPWYLSSFGWIEDRDIERWTYIDEQ